MLTTATFVMAGVESLSSFMSMFALNLHDYPDARRRLVADPALIAPAIEESLRFNTSAQRFKRIATRDVELHGETIARRRQGRAGLRLGQSRRTQIPRSGHVRYRPPPAGTFGLRLRQAFLPRQPDGAAGHRSRHAALSRARAGLSPHRRQGGVEFVVEFPQSRRRCRSLRQRLELDRTNSIRHARARRGHPRLQAASNRDTDGSEQSGHDVLQFNSNSAGSTCPQPRRRAARGPADRARH